ncbi:MAG: hypothetical protein HFI72_07275 [Peptococcaceae bacterium]|nr:hypothetical protein [Peptococcaceae bacterium]
MVPPIPQAAWAAPSSTGTLAGSFAPQSNKIYNLANGGDYSLQSADISNTTFVLSSGSATLRVPANQTVKIDDYENGCSPISLGGNGKLTLIVDGTLVVTGGKAEKGGDVTRSTASGSTVISPGKAGANGYAGIGVPVGTSLTISGSGSLTARGGDAGRGGDSISGIGGNNVGGGGGGGAGAGIGGNGGGGGVGGTASKDGGNGMAGQGMGTVAVYGTVTVNAYGGGGGSGSINQTHDTGGAGGYPAAGIGGGGAGGGGGEWDNPGGGFTAGRGQGNTDNSYLPIDGEGSGNAAWGIAGGYFKADYTTEHPVSYAIVQGLGGIGSTYTNHGAGDASRTKAGDGGQGGAGGTVVKGELATLQVANGSYQTTIPQNYGKAPTPIYAQSGFNLTNIRSANLTAVTARTKAALETELSGKVSKTIAVTNVAGIGSGAGAYEVSNGSFTIQKVPERVALAGEHFKR